MTKTVDVVLIGGGIMSATLGTLLHELQPDWKITAFERLPKVAEESSSAWNNAGTGHSALCELNYTPMNAAGEVDIAKALNINEQFQVTRQFWTSLIARGVLNEPDTFINSTPHMTFVRGEKNVDLLRKRYALLKRQPLFASMEYSEDSRVIHQWAPLLMDRRLEADKPFAATRVTGGTDVDFGSLTRQLFAHLRRSGVDVLTDTEVRGVDRRKDGTWGVRYRRTIGHGPGRINARFVFVGAGGWALRLLQNSGIPEIKGYGCFPIGGQWLMTSDPGIVAKHQAKVYSKATIGAPPMSVPHLDTRVIDGKKSLLFGPFATFSPKFLKTGSMWDIVRQVRFTNIFSMLKVAFTNFDLIRYLISELAKSHGRKVDDLRQLMPAAKDADWTLLQAGQRAQVMHNGKLQFGTEVISHADGSIAGLLGASPGASTAVPIMLDLVKKCFPDRMPAWEPVLRELIPTYGQKLNDEPAEFTATFARTAKALDLSL